MHEWMTANNQTPHLVVDTASPSAEVPRAYVRDGRITLNVSWQATQGLKLGNEWIEFSARFGGVARQISVPIANVYALYARETGHGMTFDIDGPKPSVQSRAESENSAPPRPPTALPAPTTPDPKKPSGGGKPTLRRIK
jgi:stringent starvation protein B